MDKPTSPEMILKDADRIFGNACKLLQRSFHHERKRIVFDGAAGEVEETGFNYFGDLLAEADRARGAQ